MTGAASEPRLSSPPPGCGSTATSGRLGRPALLGATRCGVRRRARPPHAGRVRGDRLSIAPFAIYYELVRALQAAFVPWSDRILARSTISTSSSCRSAVVPLSLAAPAPPGLRDAREWRVVGLALALIAVETLWMCSSGRSTSTATSSGLTPLSAALLAFTPRARGPADRAAAFRPGLSTAVSGAFAAVLLVSRSPRFPLPGLFPRPDRPSGTGLVVRTEWRAFLRRPARARSRSQPRRDRHAASLLRPGDEILVNYEDCPLMFYTDQPIRGGIPAFRAPRASRPAPSP